MTTAAERRHMTAVAHLGCIACKSLGIFTPNVEIHHVRMGNGLSQRASHFDVLPLCHAHHRTGGHGVALHAGQRTWEATFGTEAELLERVRWELDSTNGRKAIREL